MNNQCRRVAEKKERRKEGRREDVRVLLCTIQLLVFKIKSNQNKSKTIQYDCKIQNETKKHNTTRVILNSRTIMKYN